MPASHKPTWVGISDPNSPTVTLRKDNKTCLNWLSRCFASTLTVPLALPPLAAADACAEADTVGGWFLTSNWFGENIHVGHLANLAFLTKPARYIACKETRAQFALLQVARQLQAGTLSLPSGTDTLTKCFTSWPSSSKERLLILP